MAQRVQIARALAWRQECCSWTSRSARGRDDQGGLQDILLDVHRAPAATVVFVTHDVDLSAVLQPLCPRDHGDPRHDRDIAPDEPALLRHQLATRALPGYIEAPNACPSRFRASI